jgi:hypothetical protein
VVKFCNELFIVFVSVVGGGYDILSLLFKDAAI